MKKLSFFLMAMLVSLTSFAAALGDGYEKVTNISNLTTGDRVVVYADAISKGVTGWNGNKDATVAESGWVEYLVEVASGGVYLKDETANNYIASPGNSNQFKYGTKAVCSVDADGVLKCNSRLLCQNGTYYRMYTSVGSYKPFYVYKVIADAGGDETEDLGDALKWSATSATVQMGADDNEYPTLTNDKNVDVIYSSESEAVATIDANGVVTLVKEGTTTISALYEGGEIDGVTYSAKNVSYTLTVKPAPLVIEPIEGGIIDILTHKTLAATSSSYANFTDKQAANENHSDAVYAGRSARNGNATQYSIQLNTIDKGRIATTTSGGIVKRVYVRWSTQATLNTNARALNIYGSNDAFTGSETAAPSTKIGTITFTTGAAEAYVDLEGDYKHILITGSGAIYMDEIQVTWVAAEGTVTTPTISGADEFIESTEVTISAEDGLKVYYTLDGTDPTNASTEYTAPFELTATTTVQAVAYDGEKASDIISKTFKQLQVLTCEEAAELCAATESADKYVIRGYVTDIATAWSDQYSNISFWMADTKDGGKVFEAFRVQPIIAAENSVKVGDYVEVIGKIILYGTTPETTQGGTYTIIPAPVINHTITVSANPAEGGVVTGGGEFEETDEITVKAVANDGYEFVNWTENEVEVSTDAEYTFEVLADRALVANFELIPPTKYNVSVTAENGTVEGAGEYEEGTEVSLTATPAAHYVFVNWTNGEDVVSTENPYTFAVTADVTLVANFALDTHTVAVTAENGTVAGAGSFTHGTEVSLTATPADGYQFVNWTNGEEEVSTDNPYTFVVAEDVALVANFELIPVVEPEKPEPTYTENNLNPYAFGLESTLSDDKTTLTVTYRLNNSNATSVNVIVYNGEEVVATVPGTTTIGKNTVEVPTADLPGGVKLTWAVEVNGTSVEVPTQETKMYNMYCPHGLAIDKDPESEYFGRILVADAMNIVKDKTGYLGSGIGAGLHVFNPSFTTDSVVYKGGNDFTRVWASNGYQPWRVKISEDGRIFVSSLDLNGVVVWEVSKDLQTWTPVIAGTQGENGNILDAEGNFVAGMNVSMDVVGSGENLKLLLYSCTTSASAFSQSAFRLDEYALGTATTWTGTPKNILTGGKYALVHTNAEWIYDGEGGYWFGASRAGNAGQPNLAHINAAGVQDYYTEDASLYGGDGVLVHNGMLFKGKARSSSTVGNFGVWTIGKDAEGNTTLTEKWSVSANGIGRNLNEFAVDYAENLYVVGNSGEKIIAYALPYSGQVETPAASQYAFELDYEKMDVTMTNLEVAEMEGYLVLTASDELNTGLNVMLALNEDGTVSSEMSYATISSGWMETELPILEGTITKTYSEELATDVYSGLVVVLNNGAKFGLNLTMYATPAIDVVIENATITIEEISDGVGGTSELINVSAPWGESMLVIEGIEKNHEGFVQIKEIIIVDGEEDWYIWMCENAVVTTVDNVLTVTGRFKNNYIGVSYNVTISGNLPQGPGTALDNVDVEAKTIKMIKNGQLIIIKNGVQYSVQGQVIK